jgi:hypothetical protein
MSLSGSPGLGIPACVYDDYLRGPVAYLKIKRVQQGSDISLLVKRWDYD